MAAVDATDCAMEGTVSCASREDGRPALTGTDAVVAGIGATAAGLAGNSFAFAIEPSVAERVVLGFAATTSGLLAFAVIVFTESFV